MSDKKPRPGSTNRWTKQEELVLRDAVTAKDDWEAVARIVGNERTPDGCRLKAGKLRLALGVGFTIASPAQDIDIGGIARKHSDRISRGDHQTSTGRSPNEIWDAANARLRERRQ